LTRSALREWDLLALAENAEIIVGELVANAVTHATPSSKDRAEALDNLSLRLLRRTGEVTCAVLDPSEAAPVPKTPSPEEVAGRGPRIIDALSDMWGWSPTAGRGKAVWAILFAT